MNTLAFLSSEGHMLEFSARVPYNTAPTRESHSKEIDSCPEHDPSLSELG